MQTAMQKTSEKELRDAVIRQLEWVGALDINVSAKEGVVTLTGFVQFYAMKVAAEETAKSVYGVRSVANEIYMEPMARREHYPGAGDRLREQIRARTLTGIHAG
ncbi:MAG: BON domain-containing protein [Bryobacteraceae bacterium]|jgi:osmotically-inducible protein OsmY